MEYEGTVVTSQYFKITELRMRHMGERISNVLKAVYKVLTYLNITQRSPEVKNKDFATITRRLLLLQDKLHTAALLN